MPNGTYGGVRGRKTKVGGKLLRFPPTRFAQVSDSVLAHAIEGGVCKIDIKNMAGF